MAPSQRGKHPEGGPSNGWKATREHCRGRFGAALAVRPCAETDQIVWGGGHMGLMPRATCWLIWDKRNDGMGFSQGEIAWTNLERAVRMFRFRWSGFRQQDMKHKEARVHPTQKPVPLMEWCLSWVPTAKTVLDPFAGAGSTLIAARRRGLRAIGIERELRYCQAAVRRFETDGKPLKAPLSNG